MKTSYQRELKRNYLIVETETSEGQGEPPFEQKMLEQNQIDGILRFQVRQKDEEVRFFYEITSKQPLSRLLEGQTIQAEQIRALVFGIARSLDHMEQYLLSEKSVLLDPEYLYVDPESLKVWLCLVPGMECDFPEDYSRFLEYLLGKVDHRDKESVVLAYGLYQETRKENYGMADILRLAQQKIEVNHAGREAETETVREFERYQEYPEREYMETAQDGYGAKQRRSAIQDRKAGNAETDWKPGMVRARQIQTDTVKELSGLFGRWKQRRKERREEKQREQEREMQMPWDTMFVSETSPDYGTLSSVHLPQQSRGTVLLNPESRESGSVARRLTALDAGETDIIMEGVRYLRIEGACYIGIGWLFLLYGLYRALGRPGMSVVLTVFSLGTRVALAYILSAIPEIGVVGIWWSVPIGWALADIVGLLYYKIRKQSLFCFTD